MTLWRNDIYRKYVFVFLPKKIACKGLIKQQIVYNIAQKIDNGTRVVIL